MYNYSIVIPHYNIVGLLLRCLRTIPRRDDIEVIVVDDNSSVSAEYLTTAIDGAREGTQLVRLPDNGGAGRARNIGTRRAKGKWIIYLDADDYLLENAFDIFDRYRNMECDICIFGCKRVLSDSLLPSPIAFPNDVLDHYRAGRLSLRDTVRMHGVPHGKMISRRFLSDCGIVFPEIPCAEDITWCAELSFATNKVVVSDDMPYAFTLREGSQSQRLPYSHIAITYKRMAMTEWLLLRKGYSNPNIQPELRFMELAALVGFTYPFRAFRLLMRRRKVGALVSQVPQRYPAGSFKVRFPRLYVARLVLFAHIIYKVKWTYRKILERMT